MYTENSSLRFFEIEELRRCACARAAVAGGERPAQDRLRGSQITGFNGHAGFQHGAESRIGGTTVAFL